MSATKKPNILITIPFKLSEIIAKGEVVKNYFNPNDMFGNVHLLLLNDDKPLKKEVQKMAGSAKIHIYNHPIPGELFKHSLGWQHFLLKKWINAAKVKTLNIHFDIVRAYGAHLNLVLGLSLKETKPIVASLHTNPIYDVHLARLSPKQKIVNYFDKKLWQYLRYCDKVLPVYKGIIPYLKKLNVAEDKFEVLYNCVAVRNNLVKTNFKADKIFKIVFIGQQIENKNPENIIRALSTIENIKFDIIGNGVLNNYLKDLVRMLALEEKVKFIDGIPNELLCKKLSQYDCFVGCLDGVAISKVLIECFLAKLPVVINMSSKYQVPELNDKICLRVPNTVDGYINGILQMKQDEKLRESFANSAYDLAWQLWDPNEIEKKHQKIYEKLLSKK